MSEEIEQFQEEEQYTEDELLNGAASGEIEDYLELDEE
tara:strand:+ start:7840 stop:7953 length:114 start_codon:yes stop_codon:yes gene_type:complete